MTTLASEDLKQFPNSWLSMNDEILKKRWVEIEDYLEKLVPEEKTAHNALFQAARYSLLGGGKRIRPLLTLITTEVLEGNIEAAFTPACALELIHTYSLIHDDLPCMDDDDFRRGKPTLHKKYDEAVATLTGDFLLTHAFQVLAKAPKLGSKQRIDLISVLAERAGGSGMVAGQFLDIESKKEYVEIEALKNIHRKKTGALISAAVEFGAIIAKTDAATRESLRLFGEEIGLAFQIIDDILDADEKKNPLLPEPPKLGPPKPGSYVTLLGIAKSKKIASELLDSALERLHWLNLERSSLKKLAELLVQRSF